MERLGKRMVSSEKQIEGLKKKMGNPSYAQKVPEDVKEENEKKLQLLQEEHAKMVESMEELSKL